MAQQLILQQDKLLYPGGKIIAISFPAYSDHLITPAICQVLHPPATGEITVKDPNQNSSKFKCPNLLKYMSPKINC